MNLEEVIRPAENPTMSFADEPSPICSSAALKNFRAQAILEAFFGALGANVLMSWVGLRPNERIDNHQYPVPSMTIVTDGEGVLTGELERQVITFL